MSEQISDVLVVSDLQVKFGALAAVRGINFRIPVGGRLGIVGESGAGKSVTALAVMGLLGGGWTSHGSIHHDGVDLLKVHEREFTSRRGRTLSMVFQDPSSSLNPTQRVGKQISSVIRRHTKANRAEASQQALDLVKSLGLPRPKSIFRSYPHQLSGGQRQRIMIAIALSCYPDLIVADEPTTALDVSVQKAVLRLLDDAVSERACALLMITHDLPVIAAMCEEVAVMYCGRIVEMGPVSDVFTSPKHPYTAALLRAQPTMDNIATDGSSRLRSIPGSVPSLSEIPTGCAFRSRCPRATKVCEEQPSMEGSASHAAECWHQLLPDSLGGMQ